MDDLNDHLNEMDRNRETEDGRPSLVVQASQVDTEANLLRFYERLEELGVNLSELKDILESENSLLAISGAGAGKTTGIVLKIWRDILAGKMVNYKLVDTPNGKQQIAVPARILVSTFLNSGAKEIQSAFFEWGRKLGVTGYDASNLQFRTIHAEVMDALRAMGVGVRIMDSTTDFVKSLMSKYHIRAVTATSRQATMEEVNDISSLLSFARNRLDELRYAHPLMSDYRLTPQLLAHMLEDFQNFRRSTGEQDFEDVQEMLVEGVKINPDVAKVIANRYDYIHLDEAQDTSQLQYKLLSAYFQGVKGMFVWGDDDQTIYSWRASDSKIITKHFQEDFELELKMLSTNYRCSSNILNFVKPCIEQNTNRFPKELKAFKEGGEVHLVYNKDINAIIQGVKDDLLNVGKVALLARTNADLLVPALILELDGTIEFGLSKSVNMNNRLARQVFGIMDLVTKRLTNEFESYFKLFLARYNWQEAKKLYDVLKMNRNMSIFTIPAEDLRSSVPALAPFLLGLRTANDHSDVEAYLYILGVMEKTAYAGSSQYAQKARDLLSLVQTLILEHKDLKELSLFQLDTLFNDTLPERLNRRIKYGKDTFVKLTTIHEAKGKEWDSVYVWNVIEGNMPSMVGNRDITPEEYEEERRVFYIAGTRAKLKITYITDKNRMSPFLKECDMTYLTAQSVPDGSGTVILHTAYKRGAVVEQSAREKITHLLKAYITETLESGSITSEHVANVEVALSHLLVEELVEKLISLYGLDLVQPDNAEFFETFFRDVTAPYQG